MSVQTANIGPTATSSVMYNGAAVLHSVHWSTATNDVGTAQFYDGTSTAGDLLLTIDTPNGGGGSGAAGDWSVGGAGLRFENAIYAKKTDTGGFTISFDSAT